MVKPVKGGLGNLFKTFFGSSENSQDLSSQNSQDLYSLIAKLKSFLIDIVIPYITNEKSKDLIRNFNLKKYEDFNEAFKDFKDVLAELDFTFEPSIQRIQNDPEEDKSLELQNVRPTLGIQRANAKTFGGKRRKSLKKGKKKCKKTKGRR